MLRVAGMGWSAGLFCRQGSPAVAARDTLGTSAENVPCEPSSGRLVHDRFNEGQAMNIQLCIEDHICRMILFWSWRRMLEGPKFCQSKKALSACVGQERRGPDRMK